MELKFSERLAELMDDNNISSVKLSRQINVDHTTIIRWRRGEMNPTIDKLNMLCDFFGVTSDYLLGRED